MRLFYFLKLIMTSIWSKQIKCDTEQAEDKPGFKIDKNET